MGKLGWVEEDPDEPIVMKNHIYLFGRNKPTNSAANAAAAAADAVPEAALRTEQTERATESP